MEISYTGELWELCKSQASELSRGRIRKMEYSFMHQLLILVGGGLLEKDLRQQEVSLTGMVRLQGEIRYRGISSTYCMGLTWKLDSDKQE